MERGETKRTKLILICCLLCLSMLGFALNANASISPTALEAILMPGGRVMETKTVTIPELIPKGDVMFAFDATGSMSAEIQDAKDYATDIMTALAGLIGDVQFGVISFKDYNGFYSSYGYAAGYGGESDYPYSLDQALTSDTTSVETAINALSATGGGDGPQCYTRIIYEGYSDAAIGYRVGAKKFLIIFGDAPTHDNDFFDMTVYTNWATVYDSTGGDPGRDTVMDETSGPVPHPDDLDFQTSVAEAASAGIVILAIDSSERFSGLPDEYADYTDMAHESFQYMADETGGQRYDTGGVIDPGEIAAAIVALTEEELVVGTLTLAVDPAEFASWVSFTPPSYSDVNPEESRDFEVRITVPHGTLPGTYVFEIWADGDGADYGRQEVTITLPWDNVIPEVPLGTIVASASMIIALVAYVAMPRFRKKQININP